MRHYLRSVAGEALVKNRSTKRADGVCIMTTRAETTDLTKRRFSYGTLWNKNLKALGDGTLILTLSSGSSERTKLQRILPMSGSLMMSLAVWPLLFFELNLHPHLAIRNLTCFFFLFCRAR